MKMKNTSNRYYLNKSRPKHKHEYTKYKERLNMMMCICTKYDPSKNDERALAFFSTVHFQQQIYCLQKCKRHVFQIMFTLH